MTDVTLVEREMTMTKMLSLCPFLIVRSQQISQELLSVTRYQSKIGTHAASNLFSVVWVTLLLFPVLAAGHQIYG